MNTLGVAAAGFTLGVALVGLIPRWHPIFLAAGVLWLALLALLGLLEAIAT